MFFTRIVSIMYYPTHSYAFQGDSGLKLFDEGSAYAYTPYCLHACYISCLSYPTTVWFQIFSNYNKTYGAVDFIIHSRNNQLSLFPTTRSFMWSVIYPSRLHTNWICTASSLFFLSFISLFYQVKLKNDRLCGLVFRAPGYRSRGPGSIPGATKFSEN
jgi:hypothetical protein